MSPSAQTWGFLTNHALVMVFVIRHPESTVREISAGVGVTERATLAILRQLSEEHIVERHREGRRNTYGVHFARLASYRREGTVSLTPRNFIDGLISTLLGIAAGAQAEAVNGMKMPKSVDSGALEPRIGTWGFVTNHALLLLAIAMDNSSTVREMAVNVGITERAVVAILNQLEDDGIIIRERQGRRNIYSIDFDALRAFPRWSPGEWQIPQALVEVTIAGLRKLMEQSGATQAAATR